MRDRSTLPDWAHPSINADTVYLTDNGAAYCGLHLGASAMATGRDISGQEIYAIRPEDLRESGMDRIRCEECGKKPSHLHPAPRIVVVGG